MSPEFVDTHAHLYLPEFTADRTDILDRAIKAGVKKIVLPNIDELTIEDVFSLATEYPELCLPTVGLHPCSVKGDYKRQLNVLSDKLSREGIVAIGETGLDHYWDKTYIKEQEEAFREQIKWARELGLPIIIHSRESIEETVRIIEEEQDGRLTGVFHCFSESEELFKRIVDVNFMIGIGGVITYKKLESFRLQMKTADRSRVLLETDSPYLSPVPHRGKRNESSYVPIIAQSLAYCWDVDITEVGWITTKNAYNLFNI